MKGNQNMKGKLMVAIYAMFTRMGRKRMKKRLLK